FDFIADLKSKWDGVLWNNPRPTPAEQRTVDSLAGRHFTYRRVGYDQRALMLDHVGLVAEGAAECERRWSINHSDGQEILTISRLDRPTCHLALDGDGVWRGRWLEHERMPVELVPIESTNGGAAR
ncbi:MAG TPA: hypothetical protein PJ982_14160, partial [Lacipirellulaceae bacterium]|nr:hypothetical protein [Lacipirellulaceae bacterium]